MITAIVTRHNRGNTSYVYFNTSTPSRSTYIIVEILCTKVAFKSTNQVLTITICDSDFITVARQDYITFVTLT